MAEENKATPEQLSTIERLVKLSILFTVVTPFLFGILLIALPPPSPTEIAIAKWHIELFMGLSFCLFMITMLIYFTMKYEPIQNNKNRRCSTFCISMIVCVSGGFLLLLIALYKLIIIIIVIGTNLSYAIVPVYLLSSIWLATYVLFLIFGAVMVWNITCHV
ncbi:hypothetical protein P8452_49592 [Trifolium repens]|nr:hypothetical protein P8452_49592 [Trifolium repens]